MQKNNIILLSVLFFLACNNKSQAPEEGNTLSPNQDSLPLAGDTIRKGSQNLRNPDTIPSSPDTVKKDFHTTSFDVVENLFVFLNKKDWKRANGFYTDSLNADFFKNFVESEKIQTLEIEKLSEYRSGILARTKATNDKGIIHKVCFLLYVSEHNRVTKQSMLTCP